MRISDWSSDVCSSDLVDDIEGTGDLGVRLRAQLLDLGAHVVEVLRHFAGFVDGVEAVGGDLGAVGHVLDSSDEVGDRVAERQRKSVVSGTSVSVRVDPGGRRSIKNKLTDQ